MESCIYTAGNPKKNAFTSEPTPTMHTVYTLRANYWKHSKGKRYLGRWSPGLPKETLEADEKWVASNAPAVDQRYSDGERISGAHYDGCRGISFWATRPEHFAEDYLTLEEAEAAIVRKLGHNHLYGFDIFTYPAHQKNPSEYRRYDAQGHLLDCSGNVDGVKAEYSRGDLVQFLDGAGGDYQSIGMVLDVPTPEDPNILIVTGSYDPDLTNLVVRPAVEVRRPAYEVPEEVCAELGENLEAFVLERDKFKAESYTLSMLSDASQAWQMSNVDAMKKLAAMYADLKYRYASPLASLLLECACGWSPNRSDKQLALQDADALSQFAEALRETAKTDLSYRRKYPARQGHYLENINQLMRQSVELYGKNMGGCETYRAISFGAMQRVRQLLRHDGVWAKYLKALPATPTPPKRKNNNQ